jgi:hypothetical protein
MSVYRGQNLPIGIFADAKLPGGISALDIMYSL